MITPVELALSRAVLARGGLLVYPTEGVFGIGCDPDNQEALTTLLHVKQRSPDKGLIVVAADLAQLQPYIDWVQLGSTIQQQIIASWPGPHTWLVPASARCSTLLTGQFSTLAVRVCGHPLVRALCDMLGKPITSSSANLSGEPAAAAFDDLSPALLAQVDGVLPMPTLGNKQPSSIRDARDGKWIRR